jgi:hypothetical protein
VQIFLEILDSSTVSGSASVAPRSDVRAAVGSVAN